jgi:hypothetical protein
MDEYSKYEIAHTVLVGSLVIPSTALWLCSLFLARRKEDPARRFTIFYKIALGVWTIFLCWDTISYILYLINIFVNDYYNMETYAPVAQAGDRTLYVGRLFECIAHVFILLTLVELAFGTFYALNGTRSWMHQISNRIAYSVAGVLVGVEVAHFAFAQSFYSDIYGPDGLAFYTAERPGDDMMSKVMYARRLFLAFVTLLFVASATMLGLAILIFTKVGKASRLRKPATLLLVSSILWATRNAWRVAEFGAWSGTECYTCSSYPYANEVLDPVLNVWITFAVLVCLYVVGTRKDKAGLWTTNLHGEVSPPEYGTHAEEGKPSGVS